MARQKSSTSCPLIYKRLKRLLKASAAVMTVNASSSCYTFTFFLVRVCCCCRAEKKEREMITPSWTDIGRQQMIFNRLRVGSPSAAAASLESPPTKTQRERARHWNRASSTWHIKKPPSIVCSDLLATLPFATLPFYSRHYVSGVTYCMEGRKSQQRTVIKDSFLSKVTR